jgi:tetratricopeptide (TPR) repeat protein
LKVWDVSSGRELLTLAGHSFIVAAVAFSPDGRRIVSAAWDRTLKVWEADTGHELLTLRGHNDAVAAVAFSRDGRRIASASWDRTLKLWDASIAPDVFTLEGQAGALTGVAFSAGGKRIVGWEKGRPLVWDARSGQPLSEGKADRRQEPRQRAVSPDGKLEAVVEGGVLRVTGGIALAEVQRRRRERERERLGRLAGFDRRWHAAEAEAAASKGPLFAAVFHLDRLLAGLPEQRAALLRRRNALLAEVLRRDRKDAWAALKLGRAAVMAPGSVPANKALLPAVTALARARKEALVQRTLGGLLLRAGSTKEAIAALEVALRRRGADAPPVEELLLALAHRQRGQRDAARRYLDAALRRQAGVRRNPLDGETLYELELLLAEARKAVGGPRKSPK